MQESKDVDREKPVEDDRRNASELVEDLEPDQDTSTNVVGGLNPQPFPPSQT